MNWDDLTADLAKVDAGELAMDEQQVLRLRALDLQNRAWKALMEGTIDRKENDKIQRVAMQTLKAVREAEAAKKQAEPKRWRRRKQFLYLRGPLSGKE